MRGLIVMLLAAVAPGLLSAQGGRNEEFYYPGAFNWQFLHNYQDAARLFNAFDYGHAILYERLLVDRAGAVDRLEGREFRYLVDDLLRRPPRFSVAEEAIMPRYSRMVWRAKLMFERAHVLHRQLYDVYADERLTRDQQGSLVEGLIDYYLNDRAYAFTDQPKAMALMDDQYFSKIFRTDFPKFNGLIWAYHWLQVGLYEPLMAEPDAAAKRAGVGETLARFWAMVDGGPSALPSVMPMTSAVAPHFSARHPRAAIIFDNLHMMHDIISDVLASPKVPDADKASVIEAALDEFQDPTSNVIDLEHWRTMADHMGGVDKMGGVAGRPGAQPPAHRHH
ncbi:MAG: hypothetical protein ACYC2K_11415 [Gemmatimonadales bacterium]